MGSADIDRAQEDDFFVQLRERHCKRLGRVSILLVVLLFAISVRAALAGHWHYVALCAAVLCVLLPARRRSTESAAELAVSMGLLGLTLVLSVFMWKGQGLYSSVLIAFPAMLVVAGVTTSERHFWTLLAVMLSAIGLIGVAGELGYHAFTALPMGISRLLVISSILLACAGTVVWLMREMRSMQASLKSEAKRLQCSRARLTHLAGHDALTGLSNRSAFNQHVAEMIEQARSNERLMALLYMDMDNFKTINDSLGHSAGDELINAIANRLKQVVRDADILCRQSGDEFVMALADIDEVQTAVNVANRMREVVSQPFELSSKQLLTSLSVGISVFPVDGADADTLMRKAEMAMFHAKKAGRNTHFVHRDDLIPDTHERLDIEQALRLALARTESMLLEKSDQFLQLLHDLKQLGVGLAIDDFGTGYSNLSYLQRFQVDRLKVDKSFVRDLSSNEQNRAIVTAVIQMAHSLKLKVTAEGIEHQLVQRILKSLGCDHAQGYLFSKPMGD